MIRRLHVLPPLPRDEAVSETRLKVAPESGVRVACACPCPWADTEPCGTTCILGLIAEHGAMTVRHVARVLGTSKSDVHNIERRAIAKLLTQPDIELPEEHDGWTDYSEDAEW